jgi:hypothetical protein
MAGLGWKLAIAGAVVGVLVADGIDAGQRAPAALEIAPTVPQHAQAPPTVRFAAAQRPSPSFPPQPPPGADTRPPLPELWAEPYVVCGTTIIPARPNVDPRFVKPAVPALPLARSEPGQAAPRQVLPTIRRVPTRLCTPADARPRNPDVPRSR